MDKTTNSNQHFAFSKENYILLAISFGLVIIGYMLMSGGGQENPNIFYPDGDPSNTPHIFSFRRITFAPIVVLLGYALTIFAIMAKPDSKIIKIIFRK